MSALKQENIIGVIGAGTMGAGIAQVAADAGHSVILFDIADGAAQKGVAGVRKGLMRLVEKGKRTAASVDELVARIRPVQVLDELTDAKLIIEAIVEDLDVKQSVIADLEALCADDTIIASNTSSISISALAAQTKRPERIVGMHFFNPAAILKLVEVISGLQTAPSIAQTVYETAAAWGKSPVHAKSTPGFVVNRVARPFYAEALRSLTEQVADVPVIDVLMRECGGFKMGPLELIDLIGLDVNRAVTESVYNAYYQDKRFQPSVLQAEMVAAGLLGRKSGRGFYDYNGEKALPVFEEVRALEPTVIRAGAVSGLLATLVNMLHERASKEGYNAEKGSMEGDALMIGTVRLQLTDGRTATQCAADSGVDNVVLIDYVHDIQQAKCIAITLAHQADRSAVSKVIAWLQAVGIQIAVIKDAPGMQVMRTIAMLVNEAYDAVNQGVCEELAVDTAMKNGVSYPKGPIEWGNEIGLARIVTVLQNLQKLYGEERYRVSPLLLNKAVF